jgi:hypothetical protein
MGMAIEVETKIPQIKIEVKVARFDPSSKSHMK